MLTQVNYIDHMGSICPFCGKKLTILKVNKFYYKKQIQYKEYHCICKQNHFCIVKVNNDINEITDYATIKQMYVFTEDWNDYCTKNIGDMLI